MERHINNQNKIMRTNKKIALCGVLGALALVMAFLEGLIPQMPMMPPGAKPGLSNIVNMFAAGALGLPYAIFIALIKAFFAFFTRGITAGIMSLLGGIVSTIFAWFMLKRTNISYVTIGIICAISHNIMQMLVAYFLTSAGILYYAPSLILFGVCTGILSGVILYLIYTRLNKLIRVVNKNVNYT